MRFWLGGPRIFGARTGVSFGPEDFRRKTLDTSFVYVILGEHGLVKIGVSSDPEKRRAALQTGSPHVLRTIYATPIYNSYVIEAAAHAALADYRTTGEWFFCTPEMAISVVNECVSRLGIFTPQKSRLFHIAILAGVIVGVTVAIGLLYV